MIRDILNQGILLYVIAGICILGVFSRFVLNILFHSFARESDNMAATKNKLIRQIRLKFENTYRASSGVNNVQALVDKYIYKYKFLGMYLHSLKRFTIHTMLLCLGLGAAGAGAAYWLDEPIETVLIYGGSGIGAALIIGFSIYLFHEKYSKNVMIANIEDYLENSLANRLRNECDAEAEVKAERRRQLAKRKLEEQEEDGEKQNYEAKEQIAAAQESDIQKKRTRKKSVDEDIMQMKKSLDQIAADNTEKHHETGKVTKEEQQAIIEEILKEYLS